MVVGDAHQILATLFLAGMIIVYRSVSFGTVSGLLIAVVATMFYWFAQGQAYSITCFDVRVAFLLNPDRVMLSLAIPTYLLKHMFAWIAVMVPFAWYRREDDVTTSPAALLSLFNQSKGCGSILS